MIVALLRLLGLSTEQATKVWIWLVICIVVLVALGGLILK